MEEQTDLRQVATRTFTVVRQRTPGTQDQPHGPKRRAERSDARQRSGTPHEHTPRPLEARGQARSASRERAHRPPRARRHGPRRTSKLSSPANRRGKSSPAGGGGEEGGNLRATQPPRAEGGKGEKTKPAREEGRREEGRRARARATAGSRARHAARQRAAHRGTTDGARDGSPPALKSRARTLSNFS